MAVEEAEYSVVEQREGWEIRDYAPRIEARVTVRAAYEEAGNEGFRVLAGYIFGGNRPNTKIDMTAPVSVREVGQTIEMTAPVSLTSSGEGRWEVAFVMPREWTLESLPLPDDSRIELTPLPPERYAVIRFRGRTPRADVERQQTLLLEKLEQAGIEPLGPPVLARFNPPWIPGFLRRNEILIPLAR